MNLPALLGLSSPLAGVEMPFRVLLLAFPAGLVLGDALVGSATTGRITPRTLRILGLAAGALVVLAALTSSAAVVWLLLALAAVANNRVHRMQQALAGRLAPTGRDAMRASSAASFGIAAASLASMFAAARPLEAATVGALMCGALVLPDTIHRARQRHQGEAQGLPRERRLGLAVGYLAPIAVACTARPISLPVLLGLGLGVVLGLVAWCTMLVQLGQRLRRSPVVAMVPFVCALLGTIVLTTAPHPILAVLGALLLGLATTPVAIRPWHVAEGRPEHYFRVFAATALIALVVGA